MVVSKMETVQLSVNLNRQNGERMIKYIDNSCLCGWYYVTSEGEAYGDGTYEQAERTRENFIDCEVE